MYVCGVCGAEFDPEGYQLVVNGRSYHSVDCAVRALERTAIELEPESVAAGEPQPTPAYGRVYSLAGLVGPSEERRPFRRLAAS
jgi:hypothetical protein